MLARDGWIQVRTSLHLYSVCCIHISLVSTCPTPPLTFLYWQFPLFSFSLGEVPGMLTVHFPPHMLHDTLNTSSFFFATDSRIWHLFCLHYTFSPSTYSNHIYVYLFFFLLLFFRNLFSFKMLILNCYK